MVHAQPTDDATAIESMVDAIARGVPKDVRLNRAAVRLEQKRALDRTRWTLANPSRLEPRALLSISFTLPGGTLADAQGLVTKTLGEDWAVGPVDASRGRYMASDPPRAVLEPEAWSLAYRFGEPAVAEPSFEEVAVPRTEALDTKAIIAPSARFLELPQQTDWNLIDTGVKCAPGSDACAWKLEPSPGEGVRLCQLDTGYTDHPEVKTTRELVKGSNLVEPKTAPDDPRDPATDHQKGLFPGHGTAASSVIISDEGPHHACQGGAACLILDGEPSTSCPAVGECDYVSGVAPKVRFLPFRVGRSVVYAAGLPNLVFKSDPRNIALALNRAVEANCEVVSMALGTLQSLLDIRTAVHAASAKGIILVAAAGQYVPLLGPAWPARFAGAPGKNDAAEPIVAVGGVEPAVVGGKHGLAPWKSTMSGPEVTLSAPAKEIRAAHVEYSQRAQGGLLFDLETGEGTTFATGQVAGVAAIWLQHQRKAAQEPLPEAVAAKFPKLKQTYGANPAFVPCAFKAALRVTAVKPQEWDDNFGAGVVDAYRAIGALEQPAALEKEVGNCLQRFTASERELRTKGRPGFSPLVSIEEKKEFTLKRPAVPLVEAFAKALGKPAAAAKYSPELAALYAGHPELRVPSAKVKEALKELASPELKKTLGL